MSKVEIINFTGKSCNPFASWQPGPLNAAEFEQQYAARLLAFTKNTRLNMSPEGMHKFIDMPWEDILKELDYMAGTIPSSWEFVDVTFTIMGVSRACAQQITRTRFTPMDGDIFGSYAMQSMRVTEINEIGYHINPELEPSVQAYIAAKHHQASEAYHEAIKLGVPVQDARGLLPLDTLCNLVVKFNLRQLVDMLRTRDESLRVQGEYGDVAHQMKLAVLSIWPWSEKFFEPKDTKAIKMIETVAQNLRSYSGLTDFGSARADLKDEATTLAKAADLLKK